MERKLTIILLIAILGHFFFRVWTYREKYLIPFDPQEWKTRYLRSQWVIPGSKEGIGDDGLYAYAGWEYIHGADPTLINAEMPPLGKYLIGLTIIIFKNQAVFAIITGITALLLLYFLSFEILKSPTLSLFTVLLFSFEPLFYTQLSAPYLDLLYLTFLLTFLLSLLKKNLFFSALSLGLMTGTKNTLTSFILGTSVSLVYLSFKNRELIKKYLLFLPISFLTLLVVYIQYFLLSHSFKAFLGLQKYIYTFYAQGAKGKFGSFLTMLFEGIWPTWWGKVESIFEWTILWPILTIITITWFTYLLVKRKLDNLLIVLLWLLFYGFFLLFIPVWPRYFLLFIPFLYISTFHLIKSVVGKISGNFTK